jgi:hypothetical protein
LTDVAPIAARFVVALASTLAAPLRHARANCQRRAGLGLRFRTP